MSTLKLKGSSSGEVSVTVPATVANQTITLPSSAPTAGLFVSLCEGVLPLACDTLTRLGG